MRALLQVGYFTIENIQKLTVQQLLIAITDILLKPVSLYK